MRQITYAALAVALAAVLGACSEDRTATEQVADQQPSTAAPSCPSVAFHHDDLTPGCWAIKARGLPVSPLAQLNLPAGFSGNDAWVWINADRQDEWGAITLAATGDVYRDPCTRAGKPQKVGHSVTAFANALADQRVGMTTRPVPVSLGEHEGVYLEKSVHPRFDASECRDGELPLWTGPGEGAGTDPGLVARFWVMDVDGQPVVLQVNTAFDATEETVETFIGIAAAATFATD